MVGIPKILKGPEYRLQGGFPHSKVYYKCHICRKEFGPEKILVKLGISNLAKKYLNKCTQCGEWVGIECWNRSQGVCSSCSSKQAGIAPAGMINCPRCGETLPKGASFCTRCSEKIG